LQITNGHDKESQKKSGKCPERLLSYLRMGVDKRSRKRMIGIAERRGDGGQQGQQKQGTKVDDIHGVNPFKKSVNPRTYASGLIIARPFNPPPERLTPRNKPPQT
jgi:hypothetical protein